MSINNAISLKFPNGRSVRRLKQDAKKLSKVKNIPLHQALDITATNNGISGGWNIAMIQLKLKSKAINSVAGVVNGSLGDVTSVSTGHVEILTDDAVNPLAYELGISDDELAQLRYEIDSHESNDGVIYSYILTFEEGNPQEIMDKIEGLDSDNWVRVSANAFDEEEDTSFDLEFDEDDTSWNHIP